MDTYKILLIIHVIFGFSALITGLLAMIVKKGKGKHVIAGKFYYYSMLGVFLTVIPMFAIKGFEIFFLFLIGILSEYGVLIGVRYTQINHKTKNLRWYDAIIILVADLTAFVMIGMGIYYLLIGQYYIGSLILVFGLLLLAQGLQDSIIFYKIYTSQKINKSALSMHIRRMGGAYIATFTAFFVNNYGGILPYNIGWFLPGIIGGILITRTVKKYSPKKKAA